MRLLRRVNAMLTANLNDLIDRFDDPEAMLRQAVREMDEAVAAATAAAARSIASETLLRHELDRRRERATVWQRRAEAAVERDDDALARQALARRREHDALAESLTNQLAAVTRVNVRLRARIDAMRLKRDEAARKLAMLTATHAVAKARQSLHSSGDAVQAGAFARFERLSDRVRLAEAEADALATLDDEETSDLETGDLDWRIAAHETALEIEAELATLKRNNPQQRQQQ
jgi:phage shock protein A